MVSEGRWAAVLPVAPRSENHLSSLTLFLGLLPESAVTAMRGTRDSPAFLVLPSRDGIYSKQTRYT